MERIVHASPRLRARIAVVLYLLIIVVALLADSFLRGAAFH
jgi:hypothetical protein